MDGAPRSRALLIGLLWLLCGAGLSLVGALLAPLATTGGAAATMATIGSVWLGLLALASAAAGYGLTTDARWARLVAAAALGSWSILLVPLGPLGLYLLLRGRRAPVRSAPRRRPRRNVMHFGAYGGPLPAALAASLERPAVWDLEQEAPSQRSSVAVSRVPTDPFWPPRRRERNKARMMDLRELFAGRPPSSQLH